MEARTNGQLTLEERIKRANELRAIHQKEINIVLDHKRRLLDEEIATFKAVKDREYEAFSACVREIIGEIDPMEAELYVESRGLKYKIKKPKKIPLSPDSMQRVHDDELLRNPHISIIRPYEQDAIDRRALRKKLAWEKQDREREGEKDLRRMVTSALLPFLGEQKTSHKENQSPSSTVETSKPGNRQQKAVEERDRPKRLNETDEMERMRKDLTAARRAAAPVLSSSAEYHHLAMTSPSPPLARVLSSSVPQEHPYALDHRRSSSKSDVSIDGLRSSFKNPTQPKSPKRVQFSIDDVVVSPSTSPLAKRPNAASAGKHSGAPVVSKGFDSFEVVQGAREGKSSSNGPIYHVTGNSSATTLPTGSNTGLSSLGSYFHSKEPGNSSSVPANGEESFDILDGEDDVFSFDEDISLQALSKESEDQSEESIEDVEENERNGPPLTGSSPHAGSLPIEIKLPMRRGR